MDEEIVEPFLKEDGNLEAQRRQKKKKITKRSIEEDVNLKMKKGFIRKVYGLLMVQFLITFSICVFAHYNKTFQYLLSFKTFAILDVIIIICLTIFLLIRADLMFKVPINYFLLLTYVLLESWLIARVAYIHSLKNLIISFGLTIITVVILTIYSIFEERNYKLLTKIYVISVSLLLLCIPIHIFVKTSILYLTVNTICLVILSIYLINDTQIILTTRNGALVLVDAYIPAVIILYIDLIYIFLSFLGFSKD